MSTEDAFVRNILDNPDDDVPRLVFSDWLEENGRCSHAELIRVQCELAQLPKRKTDLKPKQKVHREKLVAREKELLSEPEFYPSWPEGLSKPRYAGYKGDRKYERGFITAVSVLDTELMSSWWAVSPWHRLLREGKVLGLFLRPEHGFDDSSWPLAEYGPEWESILEEKRSTSPFATLSPAATEPEDSPIEREEFVIYEMADLAKHPSLTRVTGFDLFEVTLIKENLGVLASSPLLTQVRDIWMVDCTVSLDVIRALVTSPSLSQLRVLIMHWMTISDYKRVVRRRRTQHGFGEIWEMVASSPNMANLDQLWIEDLDDQGAEALINSPYLKESLRISSNRSGGKDQSFDKPSLTGLSPANSKALRKRYPGTRFRRTK